jgi:hypothetical protein
VNVNIKDGNAILEQLALQVFANEKSSHKALIPLSEPITLPKGPVVIELQESDSFTCGTDNESTVSSCTATDFNDIFRVTLIELP